MKLTVTDERSRPKVRNASRAYRRSHGHGSPITFHGIDTEGSGTGYDHKPVLISCGQDYLAKAEGLIWSEVFTFLYDRFQDGGHAYVGFYLAYDFTQWLRSLPENRAWKLLAPAGIASRTKHLPDGTPYILPVEHGAWQFDMMGFKRLRIRPKPCANPGQCRYPHSARGNGNHRWMYICDVGPFFQSSFLKAIHPDDWPMPIVTEEEYDLIERGKAHRSDAVLDDDMIMYQQAEIVALQRLMDAQQAGLREMGVFLKPKQWFGPGQIAQELLKEWDVPQSKDIPSFIPESFLYAAQASYYGGWFEIFAHGNVEKAWSYDINSAYPYIIANLPCLRHGRYGEGIGKPGNDEGKMYLVRASVHRMAKGSDWNPDNPGPVSLGSMLHRDQNGHIFRPFDTEGWYWQHEIDAAIRAGCIEEIEYHQWVSYQPCDCPPPMAGIAKLYEWRLRIGKNTPLGKGLKRGYNSAYGKVAQSVGHPKFGNAIYASLITAGCRSMILDAIATHPEGQMAVLMVATDGVYFTAPHPSLQLSHRLGDWEEDAHDNLTLFKPGVYWDDKARNQIMAGKAPQFKARGVNAKDLGNEIASIDRRFSMWPANSQKNLCNRPQWKAKGTGWPAVKVRSSFSMVSMLQALQRNAWELAGYVDSSPEIIQSASHHQKRSGLWWDKDSRIYRSIPRGWESAMYLDMPCVSSVPYHKRFGLEDPWSDEMKHSAGITPDGNVAEMMRLLNGE